jgi:dTDP-4-amino-4,6-dideoxygalactose transaminase
MYESAQEIERIVRDFESCATPATDFHHREHLTVAVWYLQTLSREETVARMRSALLRFLNHHGVDARKYSEEVTVFWVDAIASKLEEISANASLVDKCNQVVSSFGAKDGLQLDNSQTSISS